MAKSEERAITNAFAEKQLCHFSKEEGDLLCGHLQHIAKFMCGLQQPVTFEALACINRMLFRYYGHLSLADIADAFEMRSAGLLGSIEHFGSFSTDFVGAVLRRYNTMRHHALKQYTQLHKQLAAPPKKYVTDEYIYTSLLNWIKEKHRLPPDWMWEATHQHLVSIKAITSLEGMSYEQKQKAVIAHLLQLFPELNS